MDIFMSDSKKLAGSFRYLFTRFWEHTWNNSDTFTRMAYRIWFELIAVELTLLGLVLIASAIAWVFPTFVFTD